MAGKSRYIGRQKTAEQFADHISCSIVLVLVRQSHLVFLLGQGRCVKLGQLQTLVFTYL